MVYPRERVHGEPWKTFSTLSPAADPILFPLQVPCGRFGFQINTTYNVLRRNPVLDVPEEEPQPAEAPPAEMPPPAEALQEVPPQEVVPPQAEVQPQEGRRGPRYVN